MELTAAEVWTSIITAARDVLPEQTFRTWLASTEAVGLSDDTLVVAAPTRFAVEWIEDKYGNLLRDLAGKVLGRHLDLRFEHHGVADRLVFPEIGTDESLRTAAQMPGPAPSVATEARSPGEGARLAGLNDRYTFERFVIGGNSQLAAAACRGVADSPAQLYNPLFIYGDTGLGKTHLMHAIGHEILHRSPETQQSGTHSV